MNNCGKHKKWTKEEIIDLIDAFYPFLLIAFWIIVFVLIIGP